MVDLEDRQRDFVRGKNLMYTILTILYFRLRFILCCCPNANQEERRICRSWATDIVHMSDCKKLVIGSTNRTLHFYDISAATHMEEFRVFGKYV